MMYAYASQNGRLHRLGPDADLSQALWIDLMVPTKEEVALTSALAVEIPTLADMEEIEISNRLYREEGADYMTAVLPGERADGQRTAMPVTFILSGQRLITVRHHSPRPFLTFPTRADRATLGCNTVDRVFIGLIEEIVARQADILESSGRVLDQVMTETIDLKSGRGTSDKLQAALRVVVREAELISQVRAGLLTIERMLAFFVATIDEHSEAKKLRPMLRSQGRDVQALEVHADFLSSRVSLLVDTTLGMINLEQNSTVRILSVIAALFLPPTLIASIYGMNFDIMPELKWIWGYPMALCLMLGTSLATWLVLRWKNWL